MSTISKLPCLSESASGKSLRDDRRPSLQAAVQSSPAAPFANMLDMIAVCTDHDGSGFSDKARLHYLTMVLSFVNDFQMIKYPKDPVLKALFQLFETVLLNRSVRDLPREILFADSKIPVAVSNKDSVKIVYQILAITLKKVSPDCLYDYVTKEFVNKSVNLLEAADSQEQIAVEVILSMIFDMFVEHRPLIFRRMTAILIEFQDGVCSYHTVNPALRFYSTFLKTLRSPLNPTYHKIYRSTIAPLLIQNYSADLCPTIANIAQFMAEKDASLAVGTIELVLKHWPETDSQKRVAFLHLIDRLSAHIPVLAVKSIAVRLFRIIGNSIVCDNFKVSLAAIALCKNVGFVSQFNSAIPAVIPGLALKLKAANRHWSPDVRLSATEAMSLVCDINQPLVGKALMMNGNSNDTDEITTATRWAVVFKRATSQDPQLKLESMRQDLKEFLDRARR